MLSFRITIIFILGIFLTINIDSYSQCGITGLEVNNANCIENASYEFDLNFIVSQSNIDSFNVFINNNLKGTYSINQLPLHLLNDDFSGLDEDIIRVEDVLDNNCFEEKVIENPCDCGQFDFEYTKLNCTDSTFNIFIDFKYFNTNDSFDLGIIHSPFGTHSYEELPFEIGPFTKKDTTYLLFIADKGDFFCFSEVPIDGSGDCPSCNMNQLQLLSYECNNEFQKSIVFTFEYTNPASDKYNIFINDEYYATNDYLYQNMTDSSTIIDTFFVGPIDIDCDSILTIRIEDNEDSNCTTQNTFQSLCCEFCEIGQIKFNDIECTSDSTFDFVLDFDYADNTLDSFEIISSGGGIAGKYNIADLPLQIANYPLNNTGFDSIVVCMDKGRCCNSSVLEYPDCKYFNCNISGGNYEITFDTIESYWVTIDFTTGNTSDSFSIIGNGRTYGNFAYDDLPLTLGPYTCSDSLQLEYIINDLIVENCGLEIVPGLVSCPPNLTAEAEMLKDWKIQYFIDNKSINIFSSNSVFKNARVDIFSISGTKISHYDLPENMHNTRIKLNDSNTTGIYLVRFYNNGKTASKKIFVR